jgi:hypothetical protein
MDATEAVASRGIYTSAGKPSTSAKATSTPSSAPNTRKVFFVKVDAHGTAPRNRMPASAIGIIKMKSPIVKYVVILVSHPGALAPI